MTSFICVHGYLYSRCEICSDFFEKEEEDDERDENLAEIINRMRKEKIEY